MRALTLWQPLASLVVNGFKRYETRSWGTKHRGPVLVHAAKAFPKKRKALCSRAPFVTGLYPDFGKDGSVDLAAIPLGALLGIVTVVDCFQMPAVGVPRSKPRPTSATFSAQADFILQMHLGDFGPGRWVWVLEDAERFSKPIGCTGDRGLWTLPQGAFSKRQLTEVMNTRAMRREQDARRKVV